MKIGEHLRIEPMGTKVLGVRLLGDPSKPEPEYFRVVLPFGDVDIARMDDGSYWVHLRINQEGSHQTLADDQLAGAFLDARLDVSSLHASDCNEGDFSHPDLEHVAMRVGPLKKD